jgi:hypothetical protein
MVPIMEKNAISMANEWKEKVRDGGGCVELEMSNYMTQMIANMIAHATSRSSYEKRRKVFEHELAFVNLTIQRQNSSAIP